MLVDKEYSIEQISKELNLSTILAHGIEIHFGNHLSIKELCLFTKSDFIKIKNLGQKRWKELQSALARFRNGGPSVAYVETKGSSIIIVEIDTSKPFSQVIKELSEIMNKFS